MATAFQPNAFQNDAFQIEEGVVARQHRTGWREIAKRRERELYYEPPKPVPPTPPPEVIVPVVKPIELPEPKARRVLKTVHIEPAPVMVPPVAKVESFETGPSLEEENQRAVALLLLTLH
jgi:hypothetical protein